MAEFVETVVKKKELIHFNPFKNQWSPKSFYQGFTVLGGFEKSLLKLKNLIFYFIINCNTYILFYILFL